MCTAFFLFAIHEQSTAFFSFVFAIHEQCTVFFFFGQSMISTHFFPDLSGFSSKSSTRPLSGTQTTSWASSLGVVFTLIESSTTDPRFDAENVVRIDVDRLC